MLFDGCAITLFLGCLNQIWSCKVFPKRRTGVLIPVYKFCKCNVSSDFFKHKKTYVKCILAIIHSHTHPLTQTNAHTHTHTHTKTCARVWLESLCTHVGEESMFKANPAVDQKPCNGFLSCGSTLKTQKSSRCSQTYKIRYKVLNKISNQTRKHFVGYHVYIYI